MIKYQDAYCACLSAILSCFIVVNEDKECDARIFLEECKYTIKNKKK